jgi:hypothetical protein
VSVKQAAIAPSSDVAVGREVTPPAAAETEEEPPARLDQAINKLHHSDE